MSLEASQGQRLFLLIIARDFFRSEWSQTFPPGTAVFLKWSLCDFGVFSRYLGILTARLSPHYWSRTCVSRPRNRLYNGDTILTCLASSLAGCRCPARSLESASQNSKMGALGALEQIQDFQRRLYDSNDEYVRHDSHEFALQ